MINTFFTSDHHFGHKNILEYEKEHRPFSCLEKMHEVLIERWNGVVGNNDIVYHLGDFCFGRKNIEFAGRLNGKKKLVMGNHDSYPSADYLKYFEKLYGVLFYHDCILSHIPVHISGLGSRWMLNVHGHLHSSFIKTEDNIEDLNYFNVSVERHNLTPVHYDLIRERVRGLK